MSRSSTGWIVVIVVLGVLIGVLGGGLMGGIVGYYVLQSNPAPSPISVPQQTSAINPSSQPAVTNVTLNSESAVIDAVRNVEPAVVTVVNNLSSSSGPFGSSEGQASGSGVIIDAEGHIITNNHVVEGQRSLYVIYVDGTKAEAHIVGTDPLSDIAVLQVDGKMPAVAAWGDSDKLQLGETVIAIGSPLGNYRGSVTVGVVGGVNRRVAEQENLIQTDAAINHGNSGGPLINLLGQIVGINTLVVRDSSGGSVAEGLGFAVPSAIVKSVADQLMAQGRIEYPFIGITYQEVTPQIAGQYNLSAKAGVMITQVTPDSPASSSGLQQQDIVTAIDGNQIDEDHSLRSILFKYRVGDKVTLTVVRDGQEMKLDLTLVARPS